MSLNKIMLIGNVGKDPEIKHLDTGTVVASFSLATTEKFKTKAGDVKEQTEWHNIVCWRKLAEIAEKYVKKGSQLYVEGSIRTRSYNNKEGITKYMTEIIANTFQMLGRKNDNNIQSSSQTQTQTQAQTNPPQADSTLNTTMNQSKTDINIDEDKTDDLPF
ncbi:MAG: single-stranded DNA-binding protein [Bacteroidales bacterium]